jgi:hypothetical protein
LPLNGGWTIITLRCESETVSSSKAVQFFLLCRNIYYLGAGNQEAVPEDVLQTEVFSFIAIGSDAPCSDLTIPEASFLRIKSKACSRWWYSLLGHPRCRLMTNLEAK